MTEAPPHEFKALADEFARRALAAEVPLQDVVAGMMSAALVIASQALGPAGFKAWLADVATLGGDTGEALQ